MKIVALEAVLHNIIQPLVV